MNYDSGLFRAEIYDILTNQLSSMGPAILTCLAAVEGINETIINIVSYPSSSS
jgi:hypothetical protein